MQMRLDQVGRARSQRNLNARLRTRCHLIGNRVSGFKQGRDTRFSFENDYVGKVVVFAFYR